MIRKLLLSTILFLTPLTTLAEVVVIVNADNSTSSMTKSELARLFLGKTTSFDDGTRAVVVNQTTANSSRGIFDSQLLGKSTSQINAYWSKLMFSGGGTPPPELNGDLAVLLHVASNPNAIGYIEATTVNESVKVVTIQ